MVSRSGKSPPILWALNTYSVKHYAPVLVELCFNPNEKLIIYKKATVYAANEEE